MGFAVPVAAKDAKDTAGTAGAEYKRVIDLLEGDKTNIGQLLHYPSGPLKMSSLIVTMKPGEATGRHMHPVPTYGYIMEGEVTLTYETGGTEITKVYKAGDAFMEAIHTWHNGKATGDVPTRILAIFMGVDGVPNVIRP
ncbi:cupin domain-containing protein [Breoghania sp. L-A4]|nr:cupin domain-containing protein [Breoghania sp. L-A4]